MQARSRDLGEEGAYMRTGAEWRRGERERGPWRRGPRAAQGAEGPSEGPRGLVGVITPEQCPPAAAGPQGSATSPTWSASSPFVSFAVTLRLQSTTCRSPSSGRVRAAAEVSCPPLPDLGYPASRVHRPGLINPTFTRLARPTRPQPPPPARTQHTAYHQPASRAHACSCFAL